MAFRCRAAALLRTPSQTVRPSRERSPKLYFAGSDFTSQWAMSVSPSAGDRMFGSDIAVARPATQTPPPTVTLDPLTSPGAAAHFPRLEDRGARSAARP